jgi:hypothetical protein
MELGDYLYGVTLQGVENDEVERVQNSIHSLEKETQGYERVLIN